MLHLVSATLKQRFNRNFTVLARINFLQILAMCETTLSISSWITPLLLFLTGLSCLLVRALNQGSSNTVAGGIGECFLRRVQKTVSSFFLLQNIFSSTSGVHPQFGSILSPGGWVAWVNGEKYRMINNGDTEDGKFQAWSIDVYFINQLSYPTNVHSLR